ARAHALDLEVVKRLPALKPGAVPGPVFPGQVEGRQLPARLAEDLVVGHAGGVQGVAGAEREAEILVLLPVPVGCQRGQALETLLALAQGERGALALG